MKIEYDTQTDVLTIEGVKYAGDVFRNLGIAPLGAIFRLVNRREDGVITLSVLGYPPYTHPQE